MNFQELAKETFGLVFQARESLKNSPVSAALRILVELRISQINECAFCCAMHAKEARVQGLSQEALDKLPGWRLSSAFDAKQKAALGWAEALTCLEEDVLAARAKLKDSFSEKEIADLTMCISLMNAFNRIMLALNDQH